VSDSEASADVMIVGAGPSGLVAALRLLELGLTVEIVDASQRPAQESRAALMHASTVEILAELGLGSEIVERGRRIDAIALADRDRVLARIPFNGLDTRYPFALGIPQNITESLLIARLQSLGQVVVRGVRIDSVTQHEAHCRTTGNRIDSGEPWQVASRYVIGADGTSSTVRQQAGIAYEGSTYDDDFVLADVELTPAPTAADEARITLSPQGVTVIGGLPSGRYRIVATAPSGRPAPRHPDRAYLDGLLGARGIAATVAADPAWSSRFRIGHRHARCFRDGRVLLCGDAAHVHSPAAGQGMNTGIADAYDLAQCIARASSGDAAALDAYERRRMRAARQVLKLTDRITRVALLRPLPARALRNAAIRMLARIPRIRRALVGSVSGLNRSPLH
jgi:2-polyprenyl-6-methoxyphenol hydroxylase-like FAD-dependent oxidoreductase